jgi:YgiT-type zinc finger domain-containing protein
METWMKCVICKTGETRPGLATVTLARGETIVLVKGRPADICENCGEYYLDESVAAKVYTKAQEAADRHAEVEILRYAA